MGYFDELYAGFFGHFSPLWDEIEREREIIDVDYEDISNQILENQPTKTGTKLIEMQSTIDQPIK